jgi:hypothetical protein
MAKLCGTLIHARSIYCARGAIDHVEGLGAELRGEACGDGEPLEE